MRFKFARPNSKPRIIPLLQNDARACWVLCIAALALTLPAAAQQTQEPPTTGSNPPEGVIPLPRDAPPTGLQAPVPKPSLPLTKPEKPRLISPGMNALALDLKNKKLTINDAVALALSTNRSLEAAGEALLRAQGRTGEAKTAYNPTLTGNMSYTRLSQSQSANFAGQNIPLTNDSQRQIGASATLPIDITGLLKTAVEQAQFQEIVTRLDINRTRNQIVSDVKSAFYDVLRAQALVTVATENLQNSLDRLADAQKKLSAGTVARFDVIRAQTDVSSAQQGLITARTNVSLSIANLNNNIGIDINTPLQVTEQGAVETPPGVAAPTVPPYDGGNPAGNGTSTPGTNGSPASENGKQAVPTQPAPTATDSTPNANPVGVQPQSGAAQRVAVAYDTLDLGPEYEAVLREAVSTRPEILQAEANISAARKGILIARRSQLPSLGLSWGLSYTPDAVGFSPIDTSWQAVATVNIPLYDGGVTRERVRQARADVSTAETNRRQSNDQVALDVRQSYITLVQARNRVAVANQSVAQASESFRLARVRYNAGVSTLVEVSDAQAALTQAENNQINALYDYNNARARLDRAVGRYAFVNNGPGYSAPPAPAAVGRSPRNENR